MSWGFILKSIIKKTPGKDEWCVESESGKNLGCSDSREAAEKRLQQVEFFKHKIGALFPAIPAEEIAHKHDVPVSEVKKDLAIGKKVEMEHTDSPKTGEQIATHHDDEIPNYYKDWLLPMEEKAKAEMQKGSSKITADLGTHGDGNSDTTLYPDNTDTDRNVGEAIVKTWDDKDPNGVSKGYQDQRDANETMLTEQVMDRKDMPKVDYRDPKKPSENANGEFYDSSNNPSTPKEGEVLGLQPSYSAAEIYIAITPRQSAWGFSRESLFDQFIGNVGEILATCKQHGATRAAAREAAIKVHSSLFAKHDWMAPILERFLDRTYGTAAKVQSSLSTLEACIGDFVVSAHKNGWTKDKTVRASASEFSSWIENYTETQLIIDTHIDAAFGVKLAAVSGIAKYKKITLGQPPRSGIVVGVDEDSPERSVVSVYWLDSDGVEAGVAVPEAGVTVQEPDSAELRRATEATNPMKAKVSQVIIHKNAANHYVALLKSDFKKFPLPYAEFRRWCSAHKVSVPNLYAIERVAVELNYVTMPETLVILADQELYVSEDKTKTQTLPKNPDPSKTAEEITLADGSKLKRMRE